MDNSASKKCKRINRDTASSMQSQGNDIPNVKLIILGDTSVGKTSLLLTFINQQQTLMDKVTVGFDLKTITYQLSDGSVVNYQIYDTAGQELYRSLNVSYFRDIQGAIFMYDITNQESFPTEDNLYLIKLKEMFGEEMIPIILVGNKSDLEESRTIPMDQGVLFAQKHGFKFLESSAKEVTVATNVFEILFEEVNAFLKNRKKDMPPEFVKIENDSQVYPGSNQEFQNPNMGYPGYPPQGQPQQFQMNRNMDADTMSNGTNSTTNRRKCCVDM